MLGSEKRGTATAVGAAVVEVSGVVQDMHSAITAANFGKFGAPGNLIAQAHTTHAAGIYAAVRGVARIAAAGTGLALEAATPEDATAFADTEKGAWTLSGLACAFGDSLKKANNALSPQMSVRANDTAVPLDIDSLQGAYPNATNHIVVFIHGLAGTEYAWGSDASFGSQLADEFDVTPVYVRYNSGDYISGTGEEFAQLLNDLTLAWPVDVERLTLVGHSMGGLAIHRACEVGLNSNYFWVNLVDEVFCLGSPHRGTALERSANVAISLIDQHPITKPLARLANRRSAGIKDLRHGSVSPQDHASEDVNHRNVQDHVDITLLPNANYHFIAATLPSRSLGPVADAIGDILVTPVSATGKSWSGKRRPLPVDSAHHVERVGHVGLMTDPQVYTVIRNAMRLSYL